MKTITLITSNPNKLKEIVAIVPSELQFVTEKVELDELQTLDRTELLTHKLTQAYNYLKKPVMVEDVSAHLGCLNGLPGPFIKFFEEELGEHVLYTLAQNFSDKSCAIICTAGFYDGTSFVIKEGVVTGTIVPPRGENGWGFDKVFVKDGTTTTNGELSTDEKNKDSHRARAFKALVPELISYLSDAE